MAAEPGFDVIIAILLLVILQAQKRTVHIVIVYKVGHRREVYKPI